MITRNPVTSLGVLAIGVLAALSAVNALHIGSDGNTPPNVAALLVIDEICRRTNDEERSDRLGTVTSTWAKKEQGQQPEGQPQPGAQAPAQPAPNGTAAQQKKTDIQVNP